MVNLAKITDVAIMFEGEIFSLPAPNRHHNVIRLIYKMNSVGINGPDVQGFLDENGEFLNRRQGMARAEATGQLKRKEGPEFYQGPDLYSEDLW